MIVYTTEVANAINRYEKYFGVRILCSEFARFTSEQEFCNMVDNAIATKTPYFGGKWREPNMPTKRKRTVAKAKEPAPKEKKPATKVKRPKTEVKKPKTTTKKK